VAMNQPYFVSFLQ